MSSETTTTNIELLCASGTPDNYHLQFIGLDWFTVKAQPKAGPPIYTKKRIFSSQSERTAEKIRRS